MLSIQRGSILPVFVLSFPLTAVSEHAKDNSFYSSSDSEDEDEPRRFHVQIKPVQPNNGTHHNRANIDELKASIGNIILSPSTSVRPQSLTSGPLTLGGNRSTPNICRRGRYFTCLVLFLFKENYPFVLNTELFSQSSCSCFTSTKDLLQVKLREYVLFCFSCL